MLHQQPLKRKVVKRCEVLTSRRVSLRLEVGNDIRRRLSLIPLHITAYSAPGATFTARRCRCLSRIIWHLQQAGSEIMSGEGGSQTGWQSGTHSIWSRVHQRSR